jgi:acetyl-CoA carboxylase biotin carboxyl carrier protein
MDLQYLRKLLKLVNESNIDEIEIEEGGARIRVTRSHVPSASPVQHMMYAPMGGQPTVHSAHAEGSAPAPASGPAVAAVAPPAENANLYTVTSPIVGTFYRAPAPDAEQYVQVGQTIAAGSVVCIIEAMKIMNEIETERGGKVVRILAENGQPVEYNQPLFILELA